MAPGNFNVYFFCKQKNGFFRRFGIKGPRHLSGENRPAKERHLYLSTVQI